MSEVQAEKPESKDPVVERAEAALARIEDREDDRLDDLLAKKTLLEQKKAELEKERDEVTAKGKDGGRLNKLVAQVDERLARVQKRIDTAVQKADAASERVMTRTEEALQKKEAKAETAVTEDLDAEARAAKLADLKNEEAKLIQDIAATPLAKDKDSLYTELATVRKSIEKVEAGNKAGEKQKEAQKARAEWEQVKVEAEQEHTQEGVDADKHLEEELKGADTPADAPPSAVGFSEGMSDATKNMVKSIVDNPPDPNDSLAQTKLIAKKLWMRLVYAMSPQVVSWPNEISENDRQALADSAGITFEPQEPKEGQDPALKTFKIVWGEPAEEYRGVTKAAHAILEDHFGDRWYLKLKSLNKTDTIADLEAQVNPSSANEDDQKMAAFVTEVKVKMQADGAKPDMPVLEWLENNTSDMKKKVEKPADAGPAEINLAEPQPTEEPVTEEPKAVAANDVPPPPPVAQ